MAETVPKKQACSCALNLVDVVQGVTSVTSIINSLIALKEPSGEETKASSRAALISLRTVRGNLDAAFSYCNLDFTDADHTLELAMRHFTEEKLEEGNTELEKLLPKVKEVLRTCAWKE